MQSPHRTARESIADSTRAILASGRSASVIQLRRYMFYVFAGDWIHQNIPRQNSGLSQDEIRRRLASGALAAPGAYGGDFEASDQLLCRRFLERVGPANLADVGSNYGHEGMRYALLAREIGLPMRRHVAVEPAHAGLLLPANLMLHGLGEAEIVVAAVSGTDGVDLFHFADNVTTGGTLTGNLRSDRINTVPVRLATWDTLAGELGLSGPTFFKIDIQGAERYFLESAERYLADNECAGICEFLPVDFASRAAAAKFLERFSEHHILFDAGLRRDRLDPIDGNYAAFVDRLATDPKPWTDLLFYRRALGPDFLA